MKTQVKINITELTKQVNDGMRKKEIAEFYGIPEFQVGKLLKQANLKIRKIHALAFVLVDDKDNLNMIGETLYNKIEQETYETCEKPEALSEFQQEAHQELVTVEE